jgi:hypothetical protein
MKAFLINCNNCGHCVDLSTPSATDTPALTLARQRIKNQISAWLAAPAENEKQPELEIQSQFFLA